MTVQARPLLAGDLFSARIAGACFAERAEDVLNWCPYLQAFERRRSRADGILEAPIAGLTMEQT